MRILYFLENNWVFGKICNELIKFLHPDIDGDVLCWTRLYLAEEAALIRDKYDLYYSTPVGCFFLHATYGWPLEKCFAHAHSEFDLEDALHRFPPEYFDRLAGFAAVSAPIQQAAVQLGVPRFPTILPVGVTAKNYIRPMSQSVTRLGYFGRMHRSDNGKPDLKRGYLARLVAEQAGLEFYNRENVHFLAADRLYRNVDVVIFCSTTEGNPYTAIEAVASGVPVLGTPVGVFPAIASGGGGVVLPLDEEAFVADAVTWLHRLQTSPELYQHMSDSAVETGRLFDWSIVASLWRDEFNRVCRKDAVPQKMLTNAIDGSGITTVQIQAAQHPAR
jgi:hypothetical protein